MTIQIGLHDFFGVRLNEIELFPFMIFCGDNGSGKTHVVKVLNSIDDFMKSPQSSKYEGLDKDFIKDIPLSIDFEKIDSNGFELNIEEGDEIFSFIEKSMNKYLNINKENILEETFSDVEDVLGEISIKFNYQPKIKVIITFGPEKRVTNEDFIQENQEEPPSAFNFQYIIDGQKKLRTGTRLPGQKTNELIKDIKARESYVENLIKERLITGLMRMVYVSNFKVNSQESYYFPASREAYMRDFNYFLNKNHGTNKNLIVKEYDLDNWESQQINTHSNDPYIEKFVNQMIEVIDGSDEYNLDIINFFETNFLKVKFHHSKSINKYILDNKKMISTDLGSSLQNEYSFLRILLGKRRSPNIVIEEPEAHLSVKSSVLLAYILISIHQRLKNKIWITTHSNFIVDAINNMIMLSNLESDRQEKFLGKIGINEIITKVDKETTDHITSYLMLEGCAQKLDRGIQGIEYENFIKQINYFVDISTDLQWEVEDLNENSSE